MHRLLFATVSCLACACAASPSALGIPGDTSTDDPVSPPDETGAGKSDGPPQQIVYGGGVVMDAPTIVHVYWGSYWSTDAGAAARGVLDGMLGAVSNSSWWHINDQYTANGMVPGAPVAGSPVIAADSEPPAQIKETSLKTFLQVELDAGTLTWDAETVFVVLTPPGTKAPKGECGHHFYFTAKLDGARRKVIYAFVPSFDDDSCAGNVSAVGPGLDSATATLSHEYAEAVTDPYLDAWGNGAIEVADQCDDSFVASWGGGPYAVQTLWSNAANACVSQ